VTDGELLVWATTFSLALENTGDAVTAVHAAANAIAQLRAVAVQKVASGGYVISQIDERDHLDEIVSVP